MILLIRIGSEVGGVQHLPASVSWVTTHGGTPPLVLHGTCYMMDLDRSEFHPNASSVARWGSSRITQPSARDVLAINHPLNTHLLVYVICCSNLEENDHIKTQKPICFHLQIISKTATLVWILFSKMVIFQINISNSWIMC